MKRLFGAVAAVVASLLFACVSHAQGLKSGNLIGVHVITVDLKPNVTMEEFTDAYKRDVLPQYEKNWPGLKGYLLKSFFRDSRNQFAIVWLFETVEDRNRNFDANDRANDLEKAALAKVKPYEEKLKKRYGTYTVSY